jgi:hypothetical protein
MVLRQQLAAFKARGKTPRIRAAAAVELADGP